MALRDYIPNFSRSQGAEPPQPETTTASPPQSLTQPASSRFAGLQLIAEYRKHFNETPGATIPGAFKRPQMLEAGDDPENRLIERPIARGLRLHASLGISVHDPVIAADIDPYSQKISTARIQCASETGPAKHDLDRQASKDKAIFAALEVKFEREGAPVRAELDNWIAEQRADSPPGTYMMGDLYQVAAEAGHDEDDVDMMLYQEEFAVPDDLADRLVDLGYSNFRGDQAAPETVKSAPATGLGPESLQPPGTSRSPEVQNLITSISARLSIDNSDRSRPVSASRDDQAGRDDADAGFQR